MQVQVRGLNVPAGGYGGAVGEESGGVQEEGERQDEVVVVGGVIGLRYVDARDVLQGLHDMLEAYQEMPGWGTVGVKRRGRLVAVGSWGVESNTIR